MNLDSFLYDDKNISFTSKDKNFITFIGDMNDKLFSNISMINKNDFVTFNFNKVSSKTITKYYKNVGISSYSFINCFQAETVIDEIAFGLESLAVKKSEMEIKLNDIINKFSFNEYISSSPYSLNTSKRAMLLIICALVTNLKLLLIDNLLSLLDKNDFKIVINNLKEFIKNGGIIFNFTTNIEETILSNELIITDKEKIVISGPTLSVLNEEKIMKRLGISLPFIVMLNKYLIDYELINTYYLDYNLLGGKLWK